MRAPSLAADREQAFTRGGEGKGGRPGSPCDALLKAARKDSVWGGQQVTGGREGEGGRQRGANGGTLCTSRRDTWIRKNEAWLRDNQYEDEEAHVCSLAARMEAAYGDEEQQGAVVFAGGLRGRKCVCLCDVWFCTSDPAPRLDHRE